MPDWSPKRRKLARRRADGTFKIWPGGRGKNDQPYASRQGTAVHIGMLFAREHGRRAKVGDTHRTRRADGAYHGQASWYVLTRHGWRKSPSGLRRPSADEISRVLESARPGKPHTKRRKR